VNWLIHRESAWRTNFIARSAVRTWGMSSTEPAVHNRGIGYNGLGYCSSSRRGLKPSSAFSCFAPPPARPRETRGGLASQGPASRRLCAHWRLGGYGLCRKDPDMRTGRLGSGIAKFLSHCCALVLILPFIRVQTVTRFAGANKRSRSANSCDEPASGRRGHCGSRERRI